MRAVLFPFSNILGGKPTMHLRNEKDYVTISCLTPDDAITSSNCTVLGVVAHAEKPRSLNVKYATTPATKRYVINFTLKDEQKDSINVSCWGTVEYVNPITAACHIGAIVQVFNPRIRQVEANSLYLPEVTSSLRLDCDEKYPSVVKPVENVGDELEHALHTAFRTPLKSHANNVKASIMDIVRDDSMYSEGDFVTVLAVVVEVNPVVEHVGKERHWHRQEIKLMDHTSKDRCLGLVLWESVYHDYAKQWIPCKTVLHLTSAKISLDRRSNRRIISLSSRSIATCNPLTEEGHHIARFAEKLSTNSVFLSQVFLSEERRPLFNRNVAIKVATVAALHQFICRLNPGAREQAFLTCYVTNFSFHCALIAKCGNCGRRNGIYDEELNTAPPCINESCRKNQLQHQFSFDLGISVSDSSGMVKLLRLKDETAVQILQVEPTQVLTMSERERKVIEDRFWMERCELGVLVECRSNGSRIADVLHLRPLVITSK